MSRPSFSFAPRPHAEKKNTAKRYIPTKKAVTLQPKTKSKGGEAMTTKKDDTLLTKEEFFAMLEIAREQAAQGDGVKLCGKQEIEEWFANL